MISQGPQTELFNATRSQTELTPTKDGSRPDLNRSAAERNTTPWLGIIVNHRRLLEALQDEWLRPMAPHSGLVVGVEAYAKEQDKVENGHPISVRIKLNLEKLPDLKINVFRHGNWITHDIKDVKSSDIALCWPGVLPTFAISHIAVSTQEERTRLIGVIRHVSNVEMPDTTISVCDEEENLVVPSVSPCRQTSVLVIPRDEDAIRGAMTMAVWAVPRIDPWLDLLTAGLSLDREALPELATAVNAQWWCFLPWAKWPGHRQPSTAQECLWRAAMGVFGERSASESVRPRQTAEQIADAASHQCGASAIDDVQAWLKDTRSILRAQSTMQLDNWRECPVGKAIQLVLARPEPVVFKSWFKDMPGLPPAVAWSAATLCGLLHGYRRLDTRFRGETLQREMLAVRALRASSFKNREVLWPGLADDDLHWRRERACFVLSWNGKDFAKKTEKERGKWFAANFKDQANCRKAATISKSLNWQCFKREVVVNDVQIPLSGPGDARLSVRPERILDVRGEVRIGLPAGAKIEDVVDVENFRRLVVTEAGQLSTPPEARFSGLAVGKPDIPGLVFVPDFLDEAEEKAIIREIDICEWSKELQRRVQHYGWRYEYRSRKVGPDMSLGSLPSWANAIATRLFEAGLLPYLPDQVIVNEYVGEQGIAPSR